MKKGIKLTECLLYEFKVILTRKTNIFDDKSIKSNINLMHEAYHEY